jgi:uncharacterized protein (DUF58 family)
MSSPRDAVNEPLLSEQFLQQLDRLRLATRRPVRGLLRGLHRSSRKGSGMEFADFRAYEQGDDLKNVDWRTYMRLDRLVVKLFVEEADLPVYLFLDCSASMGFGTPSAFDQARKCVAALSHVALANMDRVSLVACGGPSVRTLTGLRGMGQTWPALDFLRKLAPEGTQGMTGAFKKFFGGPRPPGLAIVVSDFLDPGGFEPALDTLRARAHEVVLLHVEWSADQWAGLQGEQVLVDSETGEEVTVRVTPSAVADYRAECLRYAEAARTYCRKHRWSYLPLSVDESVEKLVLQSLRAQELVR